MDFKLVRTDDVAITRPNRLAEMYALSAFVWNEGANLRIALRAVPKRDDKPELKVSEIWFGRSEDGLSFQMDPFPSIFPGSCELDLDGCEDPTVVVEDGRLHVAYTGFNAEQEIGRLLLARGMEPGDLRKEGILLDSVAPFVNPKEAAFARVGEHWKMLFEYADQATNLSAIGVATADDITGPWRTLPERVLDRREGRWDDGHMSPGIVLRGGSDAPILFYNGGGETDGWRVGWAAMDRDLTRVVERCDDPLIVPTDLPDGDARDMAFVSSAVERDDLILVYYTVADRYLRVAEIEVLDGGVRAASTPGD